jgi:hypothetical protein
MADKKISALTAATTPLAGTEVLPIVQGGATKKATIAQILTPAAGGGINFSANTPKPGMTSQLLDDYEEGTWTPNQGPGLTVVGAFSSNGTYTKIGRAVTVRGSLIGETSVACPAAGLLCTNLPFTVSVSSVGAVGTGNVNQGSTTLAFNVQLYLMTAITATASIDFTVTYFV